MTGVLKIIKKRNWSTIKTEPIYEKMEKEEAIEIKNEDDDSDNENNIEKKDIENNNGHVVIDPFAKNQHVDLNPLFSNVEEDRTFNPLNISNQECVQCKINTVDTKVQTFLSICGHLYCASCHAGLFSEESVSKACIFCSTSLTKDDFVHTTYQVLGHSDIEEQIKRYAKKYNQNFLTIRDFESPSDYNIYLENIEEIVYNHINKKKIRKKTII